MSYTSLSVHTYSGLWTGTLFKLGLKKKVLFNMPYISVNKRQTIQMWI